MSLAYPVLEKVTIEHLTQIVAGWNGEKYFDLEKNWYSDMQPFKDLRMMDAKTQYEEYRNGEKHNWQPLYSGAYVNTPKGSGVVKFAYHRYGIIWIDVEIDGAVIRVAGEKRSGYIKDVYLTEEPEPEFKSLEEKLNNLPDRDKALVHSLIDHLYELNFG